MRRKRAEPARVVLGEERDDFGIDLGPAEVDDRETELVGEHVGERTLVEQLELDEKVAESLARSGLLRQRFAELILGDETAADEQLTQARTARRRRGLFRFRLGGVRLLDRGRGFGHRCRRDFGAGAAAAAAACLRRS